jgi:hypothetical protein
MTSLIFTIEMKFDALSNAIYNLHYMPFREHIFFRFLSLAWFISYLEARRCVGLWRQYNGVHSYFPVREFLIIYSIPRNRTNVHAIYCTYKKQRHIHTNQKQNLNIVDWIFGIWHLHYAFIFKYYFYCLDFHPKYAIKCQWHSFSFIMGKCICF